MRTALALATAFFSFGFVTDATAGDLSKGPDNRGVRLFYEGFNISTNGVVRFSLQCIKNWGGQVGGVATIVAYYIDSSGNVQEKNQTVTCHVSGGPDGARKKSTSAAATLTIPVSITNAEVRAYVDYEETTNIEDALNHIENELNKSIETASGGFIKKPLSISTTLEQAVAPAGGDKLSF